MHREFVTHDVAFTF